MEFSMNNILKSYSILLCMKLIFSSILALDSFIRSSNACLAASLRALMFWMCRLAPGSCSTWNRWNKNQFIVYVSIVELIIQMQLLSCNWNTMYKSCNSWVVQCIIIWVYTEWLKPSASVYNYCTVDIQVIDAFILFLILLTLTVGLGNGRTEMLSKVLTFVSFKISVWYDLSLSIGLP